MAVGMDRRTGRRLEGTPHLRQSIEDIITTQAYDPENNFVGERVRRREYGTRSQQFLDKPKNPQTIAVMRPVILESIMTWEDRIRLTRIQLQDTSEAGLQLSLEVSLLIDNEEIRLDGLVL